MKKLLLLSSIIFLSSCSSYKVVKLKEPDKISSYNMTTVEINGHTYILFIPTHGPTQIGHLNTHCRPPHKIK